jgi:hypothetical protein
MIIAGIVCLWYQSENDLSFHASSVDFWRLPLGLPDPGVLPCDEAALVDSFCGYGFLLQQHNKIE